MEKESSSRSRSSSKTKSPAQRSRDERRSAAYAAEKNDSKKEESKDKAVKTAEVAEEASKNIFTPIGKRKGSEVITPSGLTPQNKTINTGMFILKSNIQISHKSVGYNNLTDHGKAVFKNNKENGSHLLAQPDRTNVQTTNLSDPQYILYIFSYS